MTAPPRDDGPALTRALALIAAFMAVEVVAGIAAHSLALLSDAAHMLTDAAALALALTAARLSRRPAGATMTYGMGRTEILSAQANGAALVLLGAVIAVEGVARLGAPPAVDGVPVLVVALAGIAVNLAAVRLLRGVSHHHGHAGSHGHGHAGSHGHGHAGSHAHQHAHALGHAGSDGRERSLNVEGAYRHLVTDLAGFVLTALAAVVVLTAHFTRADAIASLVIAALMLHAGSGLLLAAGRVIMEAAPAGVDPRAIGHALAQMPGVVEVHDLHVWAVTSGFPALSAHVIVRAGADCHELRRGMQTALRERFAIEHTTLQVDHDHAEQPPLQIEVVPGRPQAS